MFLQIEIANTKLHIILRFSQTIEKLQREIDCLNGRIGQLKEESETTKECFEAEKTHWIDEKEKVIRYQKQLQLNYVQVNSYILWTLFIAYNRFIIKSIFHTIFSKFSLDV